MIGLHHNLNHPIEDLLLKIAHLWKVPLLSYHKSQKFTLLGCRLNNAYQANILCFKIPSHLDLSNNKMQSEPYM